MLLSVKEVYAGYNSVTILHNLSISVKEGEIVCLIGPNGAGKSTLLRTIAGQIRPTKGKVFFRGEDVTDQDPEYKGKKGLIFIPQGLNIFPNLSLQENLELAGFIFEDKIELQKRIEHLYEIFPWMKERKKRPARELSGGQRQALALGRIFLLKPKLVLLDEPSLGLAPMVVEEIFESIKNLNKEGIAFLMVEQNARKGLSVSHRGYVLEQGKVGLTGTGEELLSDARVEKLYLGG